jgi:hypothetical protein
MYKLLSATCKLYYCWIIDLIFGSVGKKYWEIMMRKRNEKFSRYGYIYNN